MWCWELNLCPMEEQPLFSATEPSYQILTSDFLKHLLESFIDINVSCLYVLSFQRVLVRDSFKLL